MSENSVTREAVYNALSNVYDPELGLPITDLGLVYRVDVKDESIEIDFTLTYPGCPLEDVIKESIRANVAALTQSHRLDINLVWEPVWTPDFMSEAARFSLGYPI
ncbi:metal-sulfur cluster assembly factor [Spirochaetia bacterium 38H-sp]|uniref:Metal-sulfur cluster assembly factor n=1 Tax=Rarispira pelagica TaxID=3141764 RepID=A0ABU9UE91_9SPIR